VKDLWAPPAPVVRILELTLAASPSADAVASEIERDPAFSPVWLRLANAAAPPEGRSTSIRRAAIALGFPAIRRTALAAALLLRLSRAPSEGGFDLRAFWIHGLRVAHAAAAVARATRLGNPEDHFVAGLLHEAGRIALARFSKPEAAAGADPLETGGAILERWRFSPGIVAAAARHRVTPEELEEVQLPREAVAVAAMCRLADEAAAAAAWAPVLRLPVEQVEAARRDSSRLAERSHLELFGS
jgi:HD-like signal output (HDOD) protein